MIVYVEGLLAQYRTHLKTFVAVEFLLALNSLSLYET